MEATQYRRYIVLLDEIPDTKTAEPLIRSHVNYLRQLSEQGLVEMCGPFLDHPGGMVILLAESKEAATEMATADPFVKEGVRNFEIRTWELSCEENNHLGMG